MLGFQCLAVLLLFSKHINGVEVLSTQEVTTANGKLRGIQSPTASRVTRFLGVRYADKPERFEKAKLASSWQGTIDATNYGLPCYQPTQYPTSMTEDCLTLDIYTPANLTQLTQESKKAVMVFIHPGGYSAGASLYTDGSVLSDVGDVVVVAIQFRLGVFGFLYTKGNSPSNIGLWDQRLALEWTKNNIVYFGGDNSKITVFGQGTGSGSVSCLMLSPKMDNTLFQRGILQSGSFLSGETMKLTEESTYETIMSNANCGTDLSCLKNVPVSVLMDATKFLSFYFGPRKDGDFLPHSPAELFIEYDKNSGSGINALVGNMKQYDTLMGVNRQEGLLITGYLSFSDNKLLSGISKERYREIVQNNTLNQFSENKNLVYNLSNMMADQYEDLYVQDTTNSKKERLVALVNLLGDVRLAAPTMLLSLLHTRVTKDKSSYFYLFDHKPEQPSFYDPRNGSFLKFSANHADEKQFIFPSKAFQSNISKTENMLSEDFILYWSNFAKTGDPNIKNGGGSKRVRDEWKEMKYAKNYLRITTDRDYDENDPGNGREEYIRCILTALYNDDTKRQCSYTSVSPIATASKVLTTAASLIVIAIYNL